MIVIALGVYHDGEPKQYRAAATFDAADAWLSARGYEPRRRRHDELAYYENADAMRWARVYTVRTVEDAE